MTIYVDDMRRSARLQGRPAKWSHMLADTHEELMDMAAEMGLRPEWLQHAGTHAVRSWLAEEVDAHTPAHSWASDLIHCAQCSDAAQEWVTWTPEHVVEALARTATPEGVDHG